MKHNDRVVCAIYEFCIVLIRIDLSSCGIGAESLEFPMTLSTHFAFASFSTFLESFSSNFSGGSHTPSSSPRTPAGLSLIGTDSPARKLSRFSRGKAENNPSAAAASAAMLVAAPPSAAQSSSMTLLSFLHLQSKSMINYVFEHYPSSRSSIIQEFLPVLSQVSSCRTKLLQIEMILMN